MKKMIWIVMLILMISMAGADLNADITVNTEGDVLTEVRFFTDGGDINSIMDVNAEGDFYLNTEGNGTWNINADHFYDEYSAPSTGMEMKDLAFWVQNTIDYIFGKRVTPDDGMMSILNNLKRLFVTRIELEQAYLDMTMLSYRVEAIENTLDPDAYCHSKQEVMRLHGLRSVTCGNMTYYNQVSDWLKNQCQDCRYYGQE